MTLETEEKTRRTLENRTRVAGLGSYKELCDFDWGEATFPFPFPFPFPELQARSHYENVVDPSR